jgi:hypothetical protein
MREKSAKLLLSSLSYCNFCFTCYVVASLVHVLAGTDGMNTKLDGKEEIIVILLLVRLLRSTHDSPPLRRCRGQ